MRVSRLAPLTLVALLGDADANGPKYQWLANTLRTLISDSRIAVGTQLPSERALHAELGVSRETVTRAYALLSQWGYAESRRGVGTIAQWPHEPALPREPFETAAVADSSLIDLKSAAPSAAPGVASALQAAALDVGPHLAGTGYFPDGLPQLRDVIAGRLARRDVSPSSGTVIITAGALPALALCFRTVASAGDRVVVESPTYPNAVLSLRQAGLRPVVVPLGADGSTDVEGFVEAIRRSGAKAALLTPDFHNPTGGVLTAEGRMKIAEAARRSSVTLIADESLADLDFTGSLEGVPSLAACGADVLSVGSVTKLLWCGLRIGWVRASTRLAGRVRQAKLGLDIGSPVVDQLAVQHLLGDEQVEAELVDARRRQCKQQRDVAAQALAAHCPEWKLLIPGGGLSMWCELPEPMSTSIAAQAGRRGVALWPGSVFAADGRGLEKWIRVPFSQPSHVIEEAVARLAL